MNTDDKNIESLSREQLAEKLKENRDEQTDEIGDEWQPDCYSLGPMCYDMGPPDDWDHGDGCFSSSSEVKSSLGSLETSDEEDKSSE